MSEQVTTGAMSRLAPLMSSQRRDWQTPDEVLELVRAVGNGTIALDPCTATDNPTGATRYYTMDGLEHEWRHAAGLIYCNPPYGRSLPNWVYKAKEEAAFGAEVILLMPARTDTKCFQDCNAHAICFWKGRMTFKGAAAGAPFPSALLYWGPNKFRFADVFSRRGMVWL